MLGSLPLMILKHDTPLDARFIRGLFDVYYKAVMIVAAAGTLAHALAQRPVTTVAMAVVGVAAFWSRRVILSRMDSLRMTMTATDTAGIRQFRKLHVVGMSLNWCSCSRSVSACLAFSERVPSAGGFRPHGDGDFPLLRGAERFPRPRAAAARVHRALRPRRHHQAHDRGARRSAHRGRTDPAQWRVGRLRHAPARGRSRGRLPQVRDVRHHAAAARARTAAARHALRGRRPPRLTRPPAADDGVRHAVRQRLCRRRNRAHCAAQGRIVLTRDRDLLKRRSITHGCYVHALRPQQQLREVFERLDLARSARPFTLCPCCNAALHAVAKAAGGASCCRRTCASCTTVSARARSAGACSGRGSTGSACALWSKRKGDSLAPAIAGRSNIERTLRHRAISYWAKVLFAGSAEAAAGGMISKVPASTAARNTNP